MEFPDSPMDGRSRKRQSEDEDLSSEDLKKKQKNRDAAKKCRQRKVQQAESLKLRNNELESENMDLSKKKIALEDDVRKLSKIISDHVKRGCKLPEHVSAILEDIDLQSVESPIIHFGNSASMSSLTSRPGSSTGSLIPSSPLTLFSGEPVEDIDRTRQHYGQQPLFNGQNSVSRSPSHQVQQMHQGNGNSKPVQEGQLPQQVELRDILSKCSTIPQSGPLAPISSRSPVHIDKRAYAQGQSQGQYSQRLINVNMNPTTMSHMKVSDAQTRSHASHEMNSGIPSVVYDNDFVDPSVKDSSMSVNDLMKRALRKSREEPDIETETHNYSYEYQNQVSETQLVIDTPSHIQAHTSSHHYRELPQTVPVHNDRNVNIQSSNKPTTPPPSVNGSLNMTCAELLAPALLNIAPSEMTQSLQNQIRCNYSTSPCSSVPTPSPSSIASSPRPFSTPSTVEGMNMGNYEVTQAGVCSQSQPSLQSLQDFMQQPKQASETSEFHQAQRQSSPDSPNFNRPLILRKNGQVLVLQPQPNGKHLVYHLTGNELVNTGTELDLRKTSPTDRHREEQVDTVPQKINNSGSGVILADTQSHSTQPNSSGFSVDRGNY